MVLYIQGGYKTYDVFANHFPNLVPNRSIKTKNKSILGRQDGWMDGKNTSVHTSIDAVVVPCTKYISKQQQIYT